LVEISPTLKEIKSLKDSLQEKRKINRDERLKLTSINNRINQFEMTHRMVEVGEFKEVFHWEPVDPNKPDGETKKVIDLPAIRAHTEPVYDVMPKNPLIPNKTLTNSQRKEMYGSCVAELNS